jgi:phospholipid transport system substrate-binding protein
MRPSTSSSSPERVRRAAGGALLAAALLVATSAAGAAGDAPRAVVQRTADQVVAALKDPALSPDQRRERVEDIVLQSVDFPTLSRLVLARNWSRFDPKQQEQFQHEFEAHLSQTYGRRLDSYKNETVEITGDREEPNGDWTVKSMIRRGGSGSDDIAVDYRLRKNAAGEWKIIDFIIEQVSLVANFRAQFQDIVASGGPEKLLQLLKEKTAKGESFKS